MRMGLVPAAGGRRPIQRPRVLVWISPTRSFKTKLLLASCVSFAVILLTGLLFSAAICPNHFPLDADSPSRRGYTVLINTFKRNDLLKQSADHYASCSGVDSIRVIWSEAEAPSAPLLAYLKRIARKNARDGKMVDIKIDLNAEGSLNNRFKDNQEITSNAIFSVDDDVLVPCASLDLAFRVWRSAPAAMVGFVPRVHWRYRTREGEERFKYGGWWAVWGTGTYSMILTKAAFFHRKYLELYTKRMPAAIRDYVTKNRNCEDIAMSFLVANETGGPPVWVKGEEAERDSARLFREGILRGDRKGDAGVVREAGSAGISSMVGHDRRRSQCVDDFAAVYGRMPLVSTTVKAVDARRSWLW